MSDLTNNVQIAKEQLEIAQAALTAANERLKATGQNRGVLYDTRVFCDETVGALTTRINQLQSFIDSGR